MTCVLQDWVMKLPMRAQGTILTGIRGCDLAPKTFVVTDEDIPMRTLTGFLRYCTLNPADPREVDIPGGWFWSKPPSAWKPSHFGHLPMHWNTHIMHCFEVVGYLHPNRELGMQCREIYCRFVDMMHLNEETEIQMWNRLTEDRIVAGNVVS